MLVARESHQLLSRGLRGPIADAGLDPSSNRLRRRSRLGSVARRLLINPQRDRRRGCLDVRG